MNINEEMLLKDILFKVTRLEASINRELQQKNNELPEWLTLEQAIALKGGGKLATYRTKPKYQPLCGYPEGKVSGRRVWRKETILEWLEVTDDQLDAYHEKVVEKYKARELAVAM